MNQEFTEDVTRVLFMINGCAKYYHGRTDVAFKYFNIAFYVQTDTELNVDDFNWKHVVDYNYKIFAQSVRGIIDNVETPLNNFLTVMNDTEILENAWFQWATIIENDFVQSAVKDINVALAAMKCYTIALKLANDIRSDIVLAKARINYYDEYLKKRSPITVEFFCTQILWLLMYDDDNYTLLRSLEICDVTFTDLWLPQMLDIFVEKNDSAIKKIVWKVKLIRRVTRYFELEKSTIEFCNFNINFRSDNSIHNRCI